LGLLQFFGVLAYVHLVVLEANQKNVCAWFQMALDESGEAIETVAAVLKIWRGKLPRK
jgi:hypothetical protein